MALLQGTLGESLWGEQKYQQIVPDDSLEEECSTDLPPEKKLSAVHTQYVQ